MAQLLFSANSNLAFPDFSNCLIKFEKDTLLLTNFLRNFDSLTKQNKSISKKEVINLDKIKKFLLIFIIKLTPILENFIILSKSHAVNMNGTIGRENKTIIGRIILEIMSVKSQLNSMISLISLNVPNFSKSKLFALIDIDNSVATLVSMNSRPLHNTTTFSGNECCAICKSKVDPMHDRYAHHRQSIQNIIQKGNNINRSTGFSDHVRNINGSSRQEDESLLLKLFENGRVIHEGIVYHKDCYNWWGWNTSERRRKVRKEGLTMISRVGTAEPLIIL